MAIQRRGPEPHYRVDLVDLHSLCEGNYVRLMRLFPEYESQNLRKFTAGDARIELAVIERCRYTTILQLTHTSPLSLPVGGVRMEIRLYHDARMAEVAGFQSHRRIQGRYRYPNRNMYQRDEKQQQNRFLTELLSFCLAEGREPDAELLWCTTAGVSGTHV